MRSQRSGLAGLTRRSRGRWRLLPRLALVGLIGALSLQHFSPALRLRGEVRDAESGVPIAGAVATAGSSVVRTDAAGEFSLGLSAAWRGIRVEASGYRPQVVSGWPLLPMSVSLEPLSLELRVLDADTEQPIGAARVEGGAQSADGLGAGRFRLAPIAPGTQVTVQAQGYHPLTVSYDGRSAVETRLMPTREGWVVDAASGRPIGGAVILADERLYETDDEGRFTLLARPRRPLRVTAPGYRKLELDVAQAGTLELRLEPFAARGVYLTMYGAGDEQLRGQAVRLLETTEANAIVVDVKGDRGLLAYQSRVPLAEQIGANAGPTLPDVDRWLADLRGRGYYVIARIVVFKDDLLARNGPEAGLDVAIKSVRTGEVWVDGEGLGWVDPFRQEVREYNLALAREAAERGFDEIQFDYIRFPTDPSSGTSVDDAVYSREPTSESRVEAIAEMLRQARQLLRPYGVFTSIDLFGYSCWRDDDLGIGQRLASLAPHVDYVSPMIYPSTFTAGLPGSLGYPATVERPYEVVFGTLQAARERLGASRAVLRPWLQYFDDYPWATGRPYNSSEIQSQKRAAQDAGAVGWMFWDPTNRYARGGFSPAASARAP